MKVLNRGELWACSWCGNEWTLAEGYDIVSKQCKGCSDYDKEKPIRQAKFKKDMEQVEAASHLSNVNYVPGDPAF
jgi:hypothetical protein